jgi:outer membrane receptor for ferrienterochelin and colicins
LITEILPRAYQLSLLNPEVSNGINAGVRVQVNEKIAFDLNLFRNDIDNLIQVDVIAYRNNGAPVYSYFNVKRAFTQGGEINANWKLCQDLTITGGYQFLMTADKDDIRRIKEGSVFTRDPETNESYRVKRNEYAGLPNRSAHMANLKVVYGNKKGWSGSLRTLYKSRWGTTDQDGNGIINRDDEFAPGFVQVNLSAAKRLGPLQLQAGIDNVFNYRDPLYLPGQPGIQPYISVSYSFINKKNKQ